MSLPLFVVRIWSHFSTTASVLPAGIDAMVMTAIAKAVMSFMGFFLVDSGLLVKVLIWE
jgi:hypothetical protein